MYRKCLAMVALFGARKISMAFALTLSFVRMAKIPAVSRTTNMIDSNTKNYKDRYNTHTN